MTNFLSKNPTPIGGLDFVDSWAATTKSKNMQFGLFGLAASPFACHPLQGVLRRILHGVSTTMTLESENGQGSYITLGGRVLCDQCAAYSRRNGERCKNPSVKGKAVCRMHGGRSTGARTKEGKKRLAEVHTIHGRETTTIRTERALASARLAVLEEIGHDLGLLVGPRTPGPRSHKMGEVLPELQPALQAALLKKDAAKEK